MEGFEDPEIYRGVLQGLPIGVYVVDRDQKIVFWNEGAETITGYLSQEVLGRHCGDHFLGHVNMDNRLLSGADVPLVTALRDGQAVEMRLSIRHKAGHPVLLRLRGIPVRNGEGAIIGAAECFEEAGASLHFDHRESKLALFGCVDAPTGTVNHDYTQTQIQEHLETFMTHGVPFSLLAVQADNLDSLRARDGSGAVSMVLRVVAQTLATSLRPTDLLGRWTETQFLAVATECDHGEIFRLGERLRKMVACAEVSWWGDPIQITASLGATSAREGDTVEEIVGRAERALQESIAEGGDRVTVHHE